MVVVIKLLESIPKGEYTVTLIPKSQNPFILESQSKEYTVSKNATTSLKVDYFVSQELLEFASTSGEITGGVSVYSGVPTEGSSIFFGMTGIDISGTLV